MTPMQARTLADALTAAAEAAEIAGDAHVTLGEELGRLDDAARAELEAAIQRATLKGP